MQTDVWLQSNYNPKDADITDLFNPDVIDLGIVNYNVGGVKDQLYYKEQDPNYTPFPSSAAAKTNPDKSLYGPLPSAYTAPDFLNGDPVPVAFRDLTNAKLYATFGLAIGGIVAPAALPNPGR